MGDGKIDLHILNGDCAAKLLRKCIDSGEALVWRETYLEGPLPEVEDLHLFRKARAEFLSGFAEISHIGYDALYKHLKSLEDAVLELPENSALMLWFDSCIFDQTLLMRILWLLHQRKAPLPQVFLYCCCGYCLTENDFRKGLEEKILLSPRDVQSAARAWVLFQRQDGAGMAQLAETCSFEFAPAMKKALRRLVDEVPDHRGLTRTHREIIQLVSQGNSSFIEIFEGLTPFEEYPFLGDTACQRKLDYLVEKGELVCENQHYKVPPLSREEIL